MKEAPIALYALRLENRRRLAEVLRRPYAAIGYDIDGTIRSHGVTDPTILRRQAEMLSVGMVGAGLTARGESAYFVLSDPLKPYLLSAGLRPSAIPFFVSTRNGACTEQPYSGEVIDSHPFSSDLYDEVVAHPLTAALEVLTPESYKRELEEMYARFATVGACPDPRAQAHPGILHDIHRIDGKPYKMTLYYNGRTVLQRQDDEALRAHNTIREYTGGVIPTRPLDMAKFLKAALAQKGVHISTNSSITDPEIDITAPHVDKRTGYLAIRDEAARLYGMTAFEMDERFLTLGDSPDPDYNDEPLLTSGVGITNADYIIPGGYPVVLDILGDKVQRIKALFNNITSIKRT